MSILMSVTEDGFSILTLIPLPKKKTTTKGEGHGGLRYCGIELFS